MRDSTLNVEVERSLLDLLNSSAPATARAVMDRLPTSPLTNVYEMVGGVVALAPRLRLPRSIRPPIGFVPR